MPQVTIVEAGQPVFDGTQYYWPMDEGSGTSASEYYASKTLTHNGTYVAGVNGKGTAIDFNGTNDYAYRTDSAFNVGTVSLSMAWWIKPGANMTGLAQAYLFNKATRVADSNNMSGWVVLCMPHATHGSIGMVRGNGNQEESNGVDVGALPVGSWTHLAVAYNVSTLYLYAYKNGVYIGSCQIGGGYNTDNTRVFNMCTFYSTYSSTSTYSDCTLDDVWFFKDKVLSASEVSAIYRNLA